MAKLAEKKKKKKTPALMLLLFDLAVWVGDQASFDLLV